MQRKTKRIYYGPAGKETSLYWTVRVTDAKEDVTIKGNILHALRGYQGMTIGCGLSNMAIDKGNTKAFPHPVYLASFTKSTALIVDKIAKNGSPIHAVRYGHNYGHITEKNDNNTLKKLVTEDPTLMDKSFVLTVPRKQSAGRSHASAGRSMPTSKMNFVHRGALARAAKAGRIGRQAAKHIKDGALQV